MRFKGLDINLLIALDAQASISGLTMSPDSRVYTLKQLKYFSSSEFF